MRGPRQFPSEASPFWWELTFEIRQVLKTLAKKSEKILLSLGDQLAFVTIVLDVSERGDIVLDANADAEINQKACAEGGVLVHCVLDKIDVDFKMTGGRIVDYDGAPALQFQAPVRLHKLQRREFSRISTLMVKPLMCSMFLADNGVAGSMKEHMARVLDISMGGVCVQQPSSLVLESGQLLEACSMLMPDFGVLRFDLCIRHVFDVENRLGKMSKRAGGKFVNMSTVGQQAVQKFMAKLERDRRSVLG